ncbi:hypothetical protein, partial [Hymenobacter frigidus]|uniref:hypothetical protein n=1 Tax=Hymenobacter frigidus TaxID=1524095 RepID=UPI001666B038
MLNILAFALLQFANLTASANQQTTTSQDLATATSMTTNVIGGSSGWGGDIAAGGSSGWGGDI